MKRLLILVAASLVLLVVAPGNPNAHAVDSVDVTVTILRFIEVQNPDAGPFQGCCGDYYARIQIDGFAFDENPNDQVEKNDFSPYWRFTKTVDRSLGSIPITIQIWDDDILTAVPDDVMDLDPADNAVSLNLFLNLTTGEWTGDVPQNVGTSQGDGDHEHLGGTQGGEAGRVFFDVALSDGDIDEDGIPDGVERFGIRDTSGNLVADMAALGADPCRRTVALEIDWMQGAADGHNHRPKDAAVAEAKAAFAAAPLGPVFSCPYPGYPKGGTALGANLVVDVSNGIAEAALHGLGNDFTNTRNANFNEARRPYFHYVVFVHDQAQGSSSSGLCCREGRDFIVSLGSWDLGCVGPGVDGVRNTSLTGDDVASGQSIIGGPNRQCDSTAAGDDVQITAVGTGADDYEVGTVREQSGTILHELGHSLGLGHGGLEGVNYKPNYLSVMNYAFDPYGIPDAAVSNFRLDYSSGTLPSLTETALDENNGISDGNVFTSWFDPTGAQRGAAGNAPINWNRTGGIQNSVNVDVNKDGACVTPGANKTLDATPSGDDVVKEGEIHNGPNHACNTKPSGDDVQVPGKDWGCIFFGANGITDSSTSGDDFAASQWIAMGDNRICETTASGDDYQLVPVGQTEPGPLVGFNDWPNIRFRGVLSVDAAGAAFEHGPDITFEEAQRNQSFWQAFFLPDLKTDKTVDKADATPADTLTYTVKIDNIGTGDASQVKVDDTQPDSTVESRSLPEIVAGGARTETFTYVIPCQTPDLTVLTNSATASGKDLLLRPEVDTSNNTDTATTTVHAPVLTLAKTATASVNAGQAVTHTITYENTGSGAAKNVVVTDTLPAGVYYSKALDLGSGPQPDTVTLNGDGTRTLVWNIGNLAAASGPQTIEFTARPTLLALAGTVFTDNVALDFEDLNGCQHPTLHASAPTTITEVPPSRDPQGLGFWRNHGEFWTAEIRARVQATYQRFDGADGSAPDGQLSSAEIEAVLVPGGNMDKVLEEQLLATFFDLATRRINAGTAISSKNATKLGLSDVRDASLYGMSTLLLPVNSFTRPIYSNITTVLDEINRNKSEVY